MQSKTPALAPSAPLTEGQSALMTVVQDDDPFLQSLDMDVSEDRVIVNASTVTIPNPSTMAIPDAPSLNFYVITTGQPVGILTNLSGINVENQQQFSMRRFSNWFGALGFYTTNYFARPCRIRLVPIEVPSVPRLPPPQDVIPVPAIVGTSAQGSAARPIDVDTLVLGNGPASRNKIIDLTGTPPAVVKAGRRTHRTKSGASKRSAPVTAPSTASASTSHVGGGGEYEGEDIPRRTKTRRTTAQPSATSADFPSRKLVHVQNPVASGVFPPHIDREAHYAKGRVPSQLRDRSAAVSEEAVLFSGQSVIFCEDELPHLPRYPRSRNAPQDNNGSMASTPATSALSPTLSQGPVQSPCAPSSVISAAISSLSVTSANFLSSDTPPIRGHAINEIPDTAHPTPLNGKRFVPLFSDEDNGDVKKEPFDDQSSWSRLLRSDLRYAVTPAGRDAFNAGGLTLHPPLPTNNVLSGDANPPIAGPPNLPIAGPSNISGPSTTIANNVNTDVSLDDSVADGMVNDDYEMSDMEPEFLNEVGHLLDSTRVDAPSK